MPFNGRASNRVELVVEKLPDVTQHALAGVFRYFVLGPRVTRRPGVAPRTTLLSFFIASPRRRFAPKSGMRPAG
jgi:hypothetical protein